MTKNKNKKQITSNKRVSTSENIQPSSVTPQTMSFKLSITQEIDVLAERSKLIDENKRLFEENTQMKNKLCIVTTLLEEKTKILSEYEKKIDELRKDNEILKKENIELKEEIDRLKQATIDLQVRNKELTTKISKLETHIGMMVFDKLRDNIMFAIQGINGYEKLECKISHKYKQSLIDLKIDRNEKAHYINNDGNIKDSVGTVNYKKNRLLEILNDQSIKNIIDDIDYDYGVGFIYAIKTLLENSIDKHNMIEPCETEKRRIDRYWNV